MEDLFHARTSRHGNSPVSYGHDDQLISDSQPVTNSPPSKSGEFLFLNLFMDKVIYTVLLGDKDDLREPRVITPGWDYICFTDQNISSANWTIVKWNDGGLGQKKESRRAKILSHEYFPNATTTIYIDASYTVRGNLDEFVEGKTMEVYMTRHPQRDCVYKEAQTIREKGLDDPSLVLEQVGNYRDLGYPDRRGLYRCGVIVRNEHAAEFNEQWWDEIRTGSYRDQISAPVAAWKTNTKINEIPHGQVEKFFAPGLHKPYKLLGGVVRANTPDEIRAVGIDQWVCVGECSYAERATQAYKRVHLIATPNAYIFPRWLFNYIWQIDQMEKIIRIYGGTVAYFNEE